VILIAGALDSIVELPDVLGNVFGVILWLLGPILVAFLSLVVERWINSKAARNARTERSGR
jgi:hypothetical protein